MMTRYDCFRVIFIIIFRAKKKLRVKKTKLIQFVNYNYSKIFVEELKANVFYLCHTLFRIKGENSLNEKLSTRENSMHFEKVNFQTFHLDQLLHILNYFCFIFFVLTENHHKPRF